MNTIETVASLCSPVIIIAAVWYLLQDLKKNMNQIHMDHREDMQVMEARTSAMEKRMDERVNRIEEKMIRIEEKMVKVEEKMDTRMHQIEEKWIMLFEKFHLLDKDVVKFKNK